MSFWKNKNKHAVSPCVPSHSMGGTLFDVPNPLKDKVFWDTTIDLESMLCQADQAALAQESASDLFLREDIGHLEQAINNVVINEENVDTSRVISNIASDLIAHGQQINGSLIMRVAESLRTFAEQLDKIILPREHGVLVAHLHCLRAIIKGYDKGTGWKTPKEIHHVLRQVKKRSTWRKFF